MQQKTESRNRLRLFFWHILTKFKHYAIISALICIRGIIMLTKEIFIERARAVHGDKYDYSKVQYTRNDTPVAIICPEHGEFQQAPTRHWRGSGCTQCGKKQRVQSCQHTLQTFLQKANQVHDNQYDYSLVTDYAPNIRVPIKCPEHGVFYQSVSIHLSGCGCPDCGERKRHNKQKMSKETFVALANAVHNNRYSYNLLSDNDNFSSHTTRGERITIICPEHGPFQRSAYGHLRGASCPQCNLPGRPLTPTEQFIIKAKLVHGDTYDYSNTVYTHSTNILSIICPEHGEFQIHPATHLAGGICLKCYQEQQRQEGEVAFFKKAQEVHSDFYDYSQAKYYNTATPITIICPIHGPFKQRPNNHIHQHAGCPECHRDTKRDTLETWVAKAQAIHENKYDYSQVCYTGSNNKVTVICPTHGAFKTVPAMHLCGIGCPQCTASAGEQLVAYALRKNHYTYIPEYKFEDCKDIRPLPFDFVIFQNDNIIGEIEYHGKQHYEPVAFGDMSAETALERFEYTQQHDKIKADFLKTQGIPQLIIPYTEHGHAVALVEEFLQLITSQQAALY